MGIITISTTTRQHVNGDISVNTSGLCPTRAVSLKMQAGVEKHCTSLGFEVKTIANNTVGSKRGTIYVTLPSLALTSHTSSSHTLRAIANPTNIPDP